MDRINQKFSNLGGGHGGGHGGHGGHGGGRWGGRGGYAGYPIYWGYPNWYDYPYWAYPSYNTNDVLIVEDGLIKKKKKKKNTDDTSSADGGQSIPRPVSPEAGMKTKVKENMVLIGKHASFVTAGAGIGALAAFVTKKDWKSGVAIGAAIGLGVSFIPKVIK